MTTTYDEPDDLPVLLPYDAMDQTDGARRSVTRYTTTVMERLHLTVAARRAERAERLGDAPLGRTDVAPLVRDLTAFADTMKYAAGRFREIADEAVAQVGQEVEATGEQRVVIPDGLGREIVARLTAPRKRTVDVKGMLLALAAIRTTEYHRALDDQGKPGADEDERLYRVAYVKAQEDILSVMSSLSPSVTKIDALVRALQAHGQDDLAGILDRTMRWEDGDEKTTVTVEDPKARRRG